MSDRRSVAPQPQEPQRAPDRSLVAVAELRKQGVALLDELRTELTRYVVLPNSASEVAVVLWIAATHTQPVWEHAPRLVLRSPEKRCGKSRLLDVIEATCHEPMMTISASPAAVYRSIDVEDPITVLVDETDTIFGTKQAAEAHEMLRAVLNAGHQRNRPATRWNSSTQQAEHLHTFAMVALAGINDLPDTIMDRAVIIDMRRRAPHEPVSSWRSMRDARPLRELGQRLHAWLRDNMADLVDAEPSTPVDDRAADTWEPLLAIADLVGGDWPALAREACVVLTGQTEADQPNLSIQLLVNIRRAFLTRNWPDALPSADICREALNADAEAPWRDVYPSGITPPRLAKRLGRYGIRSANRRFPGQRQAKGYLRQDFDDAWLRFCPPEAGCDQANSGNGNGYGDGQVHRDADERPAEPPVPGLTSSGTDGTEGTPRTPPDQAASDRAEGEFDPRIAELNVEVDRGLA